MRFMTYNIRLAIQEGLDEVVRVIEAQGPDVVAVQEVGCYWRMGPCIDMTTRLSERLGLPHAVYVPAIELDAGAQYGHCLLSRFPFSAYQVRELPREKDEPRTILRAVLDTPAGEVVVFSTHLSHIGDRELQAPVLEALLREELSSKRAVVLMGDLNETEDAPLVQTLKQLMYDADAVASRPTFPASSPSQRIDYLLAAGGRWSEVEVPKEPAVSDHLPVVAKLELTPSDS